MNLDNTMDFTLTDYTLKEYIRNNCKAFLEPIRKRLLMITPEEEIRIKFLNFLIHKVEVPIVYPSPKHSIDKQLILQIFSKEKKWAFEDEYRTFKHGTTSFFRR